APPGGERVAFGRRPRGDKTKHGLLVSSCRRLDGKRLRAARKKALPQNRVLEKKEKIGRIAPRFRSVCVLQPVLQVGPRRAAVLTMRSRIARGQAGADRTADRFVDEQPLATELDERQGAEPLH